MLRGRGNSRSPKRKIAVDNAIQVETLENPAISWENRTWHASCRTRFDRPNKKMSKPNLFQTARELSTFLRWPS